MQTKIACSVTIDKCFLDFFFLQNSGQIAPLDEIIELKEKYRFRILLDESNSFGVLGSSGRGVTEHYGVAVCTENSVLAWVYIFKIVLLFIMICGCVLQVEKLDLITASMGHALATEGGFCTGSARVVDHQVWYCYGILNSNHL
jgi:serine palmitoyltransferase